MAGDVCHEWRNQVVPGKGAVIYGVTKQTMVTLTQLATGTKMKELSAKAEMAQSWAVMKDVLVNVEMSHPNWFGSMSRKLVVMRRWSEIQGYSFDQMGDPSVLASLQSVVANLEMLLKSDEMINVERLRHGWKASLLYSCEVMQKAFNRVYKEEYKLNSDEDYYTLHMGDK
jgi:hypothetical protein